MKDLQKIYENFQQERYFFERIKEYIKDPSKIDLIYPVNDNREPFLIFFDNGKGMNRTDYFHGFLSEFKTISLELFELKNLLQELLE